MESKEIISPLIVTDLKNAISQPICDINTVKQISNYLLSKSRYRDNLIVVLVVNFGIPIKELLSLKFGDFYNSPLKDMIASKNTNILTDVSIEDAIQLYRKNQKYYNSSENYVFQSVSGNNYGNPMSVTAINNILRDIRTELNLTYTLTYSSLIKTYIFYNQDNKDISEYSNPPIKSFDDINKINDYLIQNQKYRDSVIFLIGINTGLKISELKQLKFSDFINSDGSFKDKYFVNTKNNSRYDVSTAYIPINKAIKDSVSLYKNSLIQMFPNLDINNYHMFISQSGNGNYNNKPISDHVIKTIIQNISIETGLQSYDYIGVLRKTFLYHQLLVNHNNAGVLSFLQSMFNFKCANDMFAFAHFHLKDTEGIDQHNSV